MMIRLPLALVFVFALSVSAMAGQVRAAVAANFLATAEELGQMFEVQTGHRVETSAGATGFLFAQISQGAPFDVLLAADADRPERAVREGLAVRGSQFTYAFGQLVLYRPEGRAAEGFDALAAGDFGRLAIADPELAPYGAAAVEVLSELGILERVQPRVVQGTNVTQTFQFVETGNADMGLVSQSQVIGKPEGQVHRVDDALYRPIAQDAVLLVEGQDNGAAQAFLAFLRSDGAREVIVAAGYMAGQR